MSPADVTPSRPAPRRPAAGKVSSAIATPPPGFVAAAVATAAQRTTVDPETKYRMIEEAAYYRAEKRGFAPGGELQDWLEAEAQVELMLGS
jgi:DUF2934 family protein